MERSIQTPKGAIANEQNYPKTLSCNLSKYRTKVVWGETLTQVEIGEKR